MLKGINWLLTPDVLYALCAMGHGDEVVLVDAHYPADTAARSSVFGKLLRMDGVDLPTAIRAVLSVFILDAFVEDPVVRMEVDGRPDDLPEVQREVELEIERAVGRHQVFAAVPLRFSTNVRRRRIASSSRANAEAGDVSSFERAWTWRDAPKRHIQYFNQVTLRQAWCTGGQNDGSRVLTGKTGISGLNPALSP